MQVIVDLYLVNTHLTHLTWLGRLTICGYAQILLVDSSLMLEPAVDMTLGRVMVGPVNYPAFIIPFIFTEELQPISFADVLHPGCKIDIVRNQYRLIIADAQDYPLMANPFKVILEYFFNHSGTLHLKVAYPVFIRIGQVGRIPGYPAANEIEIPAIIETGNNQCCQKNEE